MNEIEIKYKLYNDYVYFKNKTYENMVYYHKQFSKFSMFIAMAVFFTLPALYKSENLFKVTLIILFLIVLNYTLTLYFKNYSYKCIYFKFMKKCIKKQYFLRTIYEKYGLKWNYDSLVKENITLDYNKENFRDYKTKLFNTAMEITQFLFNSNIKNISLNDVVLFSSIVLTCIENYKLVEKYNVNKRQYDILINNVFTYYNILDFDNLVKVVDYVNYVNEFLKTNESEMI